ncbi:hypothetical protein COB57_00925 [Candidatus Peregrinibacteria bacterium]|nr:MAG: hypothetical protein COB57_00925 [Candidatus Peregrinibacteria bacterium]
MKNFAYIDGTNLYKGLKSIGKTIDYQRFRKWLTDKYKVSHAYIFMGYIKKQEPLYKYLQKSGFILIFKESIMQAGKIKGNADSEMVLQSVRDVFEKETQSAIIVSGDGDFSCLIDFLIENNVFKIILIPNMKYCSYLLRKKNIPMVRLDHPRFMPLFIK